MSLLYHAMSALLLEEGSADSSSGGSQAAPEQSTSGPKTKSTEDSAATTQLRERIMHLEKILVVRSALFLTVDERRAQGSPLVSLSDLVLWLFQQCGSTSKGSRNVAMQLFTTLCCCLPGFETADGPSRWLTMSNTQNNIFQAVFDGFTLVDPMQAKSDSQLTETRYVEWSRELEASIACHVWLLAARFIPPHIAFGRKVRSASGGSPSEAAWR